MVTLTDIFAGAGGSSTGAARDLITVLAESLGVAA